MNRPVEEMLQSVSEAVVEKLAFMFLMPEEDPPPPIVDGRSVVVWFEGPVSGVLRLTVNPEMLPLLAANMLGLRDESASTVDQQTDALKELANVLCGNILPAIAGAEPVFDVHPPIILPEEPGEIVPRGEPPAATVRLTFDGGTGRVELFWKSRLEQPPGKQPSEEDQR